MKENSWEEQWYTSVSCMIHLIYRFMIWNRIFTSATTNYACQWDLQADRSQICYSEWQDKRQSVRFPELQTTIFSYLGQVCSPGNDWTQVILKTWLGLRSKTTSKNWKEDLDWICNDIFSQSISWLWHSIILVKY